MSVEPYFDYAGLTLPYVELETGVLSEASVFVAVLGARSYTYAEGQAAQDLANWLAGHVHAFEYWGGVPEIGVIDNVRTGVTSPCRYMSLSYTDHPDLGWQSLTL